MCCRVSIAKAWGKGLFICVHGVILLTTYSAFHGAHSHQLSVLPLQSCHYSSTHWLFKNTYLFHRSVALWFWLFLRGICFLYILALGRMGRLPSVFMVPQHWTSACTVSLSCRHTGILCRDAQKGMLVLSNTPQKVHGAGGS